MLSLYPLWRYRTSGLQFRLAATRDYQPSLRSPWLAATVFRGLDAATRNSLIAQADFSGADSSNASEMDQAFVFRFSSDGVMDDIKIKERVNLGDAKLEVDFVGVGGATIIPIPAAAWLFGSALVGLLGVARRKRG